MVRFDPPGFLDDFNEAQKNQWSQIISGWFDEVQAGNPAMNDGPRAQFFNPLTKPIDPGDAAEPPAVISWNAFPNRIQKGPGSQTQKRRHADSSRDVQDEYCEWSVTRDPATSKIVRVTFTCEGPEYWDVLAAVNPDKVLELYQKFISPSVSRSDLFTPDGKYNRRNRFNQDTTNGAMHLIQAANTLGAEIELAAAATIRRQKNGQEVTGAQELILCSQYGESDRNSDPHIGEQVNALARLKADVTLNNPVGLYMEGFNPIGFVTPDGTDPNAFWIWERGAENYHVRASFEVPANLGYTVGDITIDGRTIDTGAQIVEFITIKLEGRITRKGQSTARIFDGCKTQAGAPLAALHARPDHAPNPLAPPVRRRTDSIPS